ncbi:hypothetical protein BJX99DRAFT_233704 [Aspergillus californicus]
MKTSFIALISLLGLTTAAPSTLQTRQNSQYPYSIGGLSLKHLTESNTYNIIFYATSFTDAGEALETTTCQTAWNPSVPAGPEDPQACADPTFTFYFPTGITSLEDYDITLTGPNGTVSGEIASGPKYACGPYEGTIAGIDYECKTTNGGQFYFPLV